MNYSAKTVICRIHGLVVLKKMKKMMKVYFDARTKIHLQKYLCERTDNNEALFVSLLNPAKRLQISGVEIRLRRIGKDLNLPRVHPHKFRRTLATMAIDKGFEVTCLLVMFYDLKETDTCLCRLAINSQYS